MTGAELRRRRQALGLTQTAIAKLLGVHAVTVSKWEIGMQGIRHAKAIDRLLREIERKGKR